MEQAHTRIGELEQTIAARDATITALEAQLQNAHGENAGLLQKLDDARRDFAQELEKLRSASSLTEERFRAAEARALMEIDRERTAAVKVQRELDSSRSTTEKLITQHRVEITSLNQQLGDLRQQCGELEGHLKAVSAGRNMAIDDLKSLRKMLDERQAVLARAEGEVNALRTQLEQAQRKIEELLT